MQTSSILMRSAMEKLKIWTVGHVHRGLVALIVIVLGLAGPCNGSDDSTKTISVIGSVAFDCNACSEHHLAFSGAHAAIKCQRGNDVSANGAGSVNGDGSFAIQLDKVEMGDLCLAEVVMPNNKLCSLAKTSAPSALEKMSVSTPLVCNDTKRTLNQKLLSTNFSELHAKPQFLTVSMFLKPKYPFKPHFFKPKPLHKFPPLSPISKPKPIPKPKFFKPKPLLKPHPKPVFFKPKPLPKHPPSPPILQPKVFFKPKFFIPIPLKPHPKPLFVKPKPKFFKPPFPKPKLPSFTSPKP